MAHEHLDDQHLHRNPDVVEAPFDEANQALADALHVSFRILKGIMFVLVVLYLVSNVQCIESHEQALVTRLGELKDEVHDAGLVRAWPFPLEEILRLPTRQANVSIIDSHTFWRADMEKGLDLNIIASRKSPTQGLDPVLDGALMTADGGLVHVEWRITYKFEDPARYISNIKGDQVESAQKLITTCVETAGIHLATEMTAEQFVRTEVNQVQSEMRRRVNEHLASLNSGLTLTQVEMNQPTPVLQVLSAFEATQEAEQRSQAKVRGAETERINLLNEIAGAAHKDLVAVLEQLNRTDLTDEQKAEAKAELDDLLLSRAEGRAGAIMQEAKAYYEFSVGRMKSDVREYQSLLAEFKRDPELLVGRLWEDTKRRIFTYDRVDKVYVDGGVRQFRIQIGRDPEQDKMDEADDLRRKEFDPSQFRREREVPVIDQ